MDATKLRDLSLEELQEQFRQAKEELFNLRFQHATNQLDNPKRISEVKKSIAKVKTVIRERELRGEEV